MKKEQPSKSQVREALYWLKETKVDRNFGSKTDMSCTNSRVPKWQVS
jgi:hypothetical protein